MNNNTKIDLQSRAASRRFGKGTVCSILKGSAIINFIIRNNLLPGGMYISHPQYGYSSVKNRVVTIPKYNLSEFNNEFKIFMGESIPDFKDRDKQLDDASGQRLAMTILINREQAGAALLSFLQQNIIIVHLSSNSPIKAPPEDLDKYDVLIESIDLLGSVSGILVPTTKTDDNNNNTWNK